MNTFQFTERENDGAIGLQFSRARYYNPAWGSGAALAGFTVAVSHRSKHNDEWQDVNDGCFRCTAWRSVAENASRTLRKGMRVFVAGKLVQRNWQDDAGNKRQSVEIQVSDARWNVNAYTHHVWVQVCARR